MFIINDRTGKSISLTPREGDVVSCIINLRSSKSVGAILNISDRTVETHLRNIFSKVGCSSRDCLRRYVEKSGTIEVFKKRYQELTGSDSDYEAPDSRLSLILFNISRMLYIKHHWKRIFLSIFLGLTTILVAIRINQNPSNTLETVWNLPPRLSFYIERKDISDLIWNKIDKSKTDQHIGTASLVGLYGLGGIGKTTLAVNAINNPKRNYKFKGWFKAESRNILLQEYLDLGDYFSLFHKDMSEKMKIRAVKDWLEKQPSSFMVYDNVPNMETIEEFLPNRGDILITSRNYKLPNAIELNVMTEKESVDLLQKLIPENMRKDEKEVTELCQKLGFLPLAISQAGGYISENRVSVSKYLKLFESNKGDILKSKSLPPRSFHELWSKVVYEISSSVSHVLIMVDRSDAIHELHAGNDFA